LRRQTELILKATARPTIATKAEVLRRLWTEDGQLVTFRHCLSRCFRSPECISGLSFPSVHDHLALNGSQFWRGMWNDILRDAEYVRLLSPSERWSATNWESWLQVSLNWPELHRMWFLQWSQKYIVRGGGLESLVRPSTND
jgi:hypothetical protein